MALLFNYSANNITTTAQLPGAWAGIGGLPTLGVGDGPEGINTVHTNGKSSWVFMANVSVAINGNGLVVGSGFNVGTFATFNTGLYAIGGNGANTTLMLLLGADGSLQLQITDEAPIASASGVFTFGNRHEVEVKVSAFSTSGTVTVYLDGAAVTGLTAVATGSLAGLADGATIHTVQVGGCQVGGSATTIIVDSTYALDTTGSYDNAPLGPCLSAPMVPNAPGNASAWTPNGAALGWECISNIPAKGDAEYISSSTSGQQETCALSVPSYLTGVYGVNVICDQRQDSAGGGRTTELGIGNGSTESYGSAWGLGTTYAMNSTAFSSNPFTSTGWALADLSTLQVAVKCAS